MEPVTGTADTDIVIKGYGFHTGAVTVTSSTIDALDAAGTVDADGDFEATFKLSSAGEDLPLGPMTFTVTSNSGGHIISDYTTQFILSEAATKRIDLQPIYGSPEDLVYVTGTGFPESATVGPLTFDGKVISVIATNVGTVDGDLITTDETGVFQVRLVVPAATSGVKLITTKTIPAKIKGSFDVQKSLVITEPDGAQGRSGSQLTIKGTGFSASETRVLRFNGLPITSSDHKLTSAGIGQVITSSNEIRASSSGSFQIKFTLPALPSGQPITITTDKGGLTEFEVMPRITLVSPAIISNGERLRIAGDGFRPNELIEIEFGAPAQLARKKANAQGVFDFDTTKVQHQTLGVKPVTVKGTASNITVESYFRVLPQLTVDGIILPDGNFESGISSGKIGTRVRLSGQGFIPNDLLVLKMGDYEITEEQNLLTDKGGSFTIEFVVPVQVGGEKQISAKDSTGEIVTTSFTITARILSIGDLAVTTSGFDPLEVTVDQQVKVVGDGLLSNESIQVRLGVANTLVYATVTDGSRSNTDGSFETTFTVPLLPYGPKTIRMQTNSAPRMNVVGLKVLGQLTDISPVTGGIGTRVKLQGKGFDKNDQIQVTLTSPNGVEYTIPTADISGSTTNSQGYFNLYFNVTEPAGSSFGSGDLAVTAQTSNTSAQENFIYSVANSTSGGRLILTDKSSARVGENVKVRGQDYPVETNIGKLKIRNTTSDNDAGRELTVNDIGAGRTIGSKQIITDAYGVFEVSFSIPPGTIYATAGSKTLLTTNPLREDLEEVEDLNNNGIVDPANTDTNGNGAVDTYGRTPLVGGLEVIPKLAFSMSSNRLTVKGTGFAPEQPDSQVYVGSVAIGDNIKAKGYGTFDETIELP
ncbi:MAG: hypothetical protein QGG39_11635, partial [Candidatus Poribacteria bacterium]|nr:hypothetical protein [Candidatus Poribacteria bacterium]